MSSAATDWEMLSTSDHVRAGTGLDLAIARGFIEAMGGTILAGNRTDRSGAVFTIRLPVPPQGVRLDTSAWAPRPSRC